MSNPLEHVSTHVAKLRGAKMADCLEGGFLNKRCLSVRSEPLVSCIFTQEKGIKRIERRQRKANEVNGLHTLLKLKRRQMKVGAYFTPFPNRRPINKAAMVSGRAWERQFAARSGLAPWVSGMPETGEHGLLNSMQLIGRSSDDGPQSKCQGRMRQMQNPPASIRSRQVSVQ